MRRFINILKKIHLTLFEILNISYYFVKQKRIDKIRREIDCYFLKTINDCMLNIDDEEYFYRIIIYITCCRLLIDLLSPITNEKAVLEIFDVCRKRIIEIIEEYNNITTAFQNWF